MKPRAIALAPRASLPEAGADLHEHPGPEPAGKKSFEMPEPLVQRGHASSPAPPSRSALAASCGPLLVVAASIEDIADAASLRLASTGGAEASSEGGSGPASSARRFPLGVPSPVGRSQPLPAMHMTSLQRPSLSFPRAVLSDAREASLVSVR
jgi:hypothetical protein